MEEGIYTDMPFDDYAAIDAINNSRLGWLLDESPAYFRWMVDTQQTFDSLALQFGTAAHAATLQPEVFKREYVLEPDVNPETTAILNPKTGKVYATPRASKLYKDAVALAQENGHIVLTQPDYKGAMSTAALFHAHPLIGALLKDAKGTETTLIWLREGMTCKARLDFWGDDWIADLKTSANFGSFSPWEITKWKLHRQIAWYMSGMKALGKPCAVGYLAVASSLYPEAALFNLELGALAAGEMENNRGWEILQNCIRTKTWPGRYPNEVISGTLTDRYYESLEDL